MADRLCETCKEDANQQCSRCRVANYCSAACQAKGWTAHQVRCSVDTDIPFGVVPRGSERHLLVTGVQPFIERAGSRVLWAAHVLPSMFGGGGGTPGVSIVLPDVYMRDDAGGVDTYRAHAILIMPVYATVQQTVRDLRLAWADHSGSLGEWIDRPARTGDVVLRASGQQPMGLIAARSLNTDAGRAAHFLDWVRQVVDGGILEYAVDDNRPDRVLTLGGNLGDPPNTTAVYPVIVSRDRSDGEISIQTVNYVRPSATGRYSVFSWGEVVRALQWGWNRTMASRLHIRGTVGQAVVAAGLESSIGQLSVATETSDRGRTVEHRFRATDAANTSPKPYDDYGTDDPGYWSDGVRELEILDGMSPILLDGGTSIAEFLRAEAEAGSTTTTVAQFTNSVLNGLVSTPVANATQSATDRLRRTVSMTVFGGRGRRSTESGNARPVALFPDTAEDTVLSTTTSVAGDSLVGLGPIGPSALLNVTLNVDALSLGNAVEVMQAVRESLAGAAPQLASVRYLRFTLVGNGRTAFYFRDAPRLEERRLFHTLVLTGFDQVDGMPGFGDGYDVTVGPGNEVAIHRVGK